MSEADSQAFTASSTDKPLQLPELAGNSADRGLSEQARQSRSSPTHAPVGVSQSSAVLPPFASNTTLMAPIARDVDGHERLYRAEAR